jgi:hypothetical protein
VLEVGMEEVDGVVERLVEVVVLLLKPRSWKGRARAELAKAAINRAEEKCMLKNEMKFRLRLQTMGNMISIKRMRTKNEC